MVTDVPHAFLLLGYGNDQFQVFLPSPKKDNVLSGRKLRIPAFPLPKRPDSGQYGEAQVEVLDLCGREPIKGEKVPFALGVDKIIVEG